ncbi:MAG: hypothetical protein Q9M24_06100 [Mariprofundaceae bacterium]|nr:hypothetical protein [Mariprofundaceae bacterium]
MPEYVAAIMPTASAQDDYARTGGKSMQIDDKLLYRTVKGDIPDLIRQLELLIRDIGGEE